MDANARESRMQRLSSMIGSAMGILGRVGESLGEIVESRARQVAFFERRELHRAGSIVVLLFVVAVFICAAAGFAAAAVLTAFGERYRVLGALVVAAGFALLAALAALMAQRRALVE
jgi:hypothetical protein